LSIIFGKLVYFTDGSRPSNISRNGHR